jgi:hypothetical protein
VEGNERSIERVRGLCPIDLTALTPWSRARSITVWVLVAVAVVIAFALQSVAGAGLVLILTPQVIAAWRAFETLDSVEVLRVAADDGWFQAACQLRDGSSYGFGPVGVFTVANALVQIDTNRHEEWPAHLVRLGREPGLWSAERVVLQTPDGERQITFVRQSSIVASWRGAVDRSVHRVLSRILPS